MSGTWSKPGNDGCGTHQAEIKSLAGNMANLDGHDIQKFCAGSIFSTNTREKMAPTPSMGKAAPRQAELFQRAPSGLPLAAPALMKTVREGSPVRPLPGASLRQCEEAGRESVRRGA